ncbi:MAG: GNAT family N-acetyltransferase [Pseudorhodoplanes sp.]|jgi:ribosomal protein S18 acetylase RimI-like enzyme|nr:GNAT family N-acetyltransferase [Pseudorhodoplanes sp.]
MQPIVSLTAADIPDCMSLSTEAGWNQNDDDWRRILASGEVYGLRDRDTLIASSAILPYGSSFGWICMILITGSERRRGHALRLMQNCIERLEQRGLTAGLDATPAGRTVYLQLGFEDIYPLSRLHAAQVSIEHDQPAGTAIEPLSAADWPQLVHYDAAAFGGDRAALLMAMQRERPDLAFVARREGTLAGYVFGRDGQFATQIGPIVADSPDVARHLSLASLGSIRGPVMIDVPDHQREFYSWLLGCGFEKQRGFTRMLRGRSKPFDRSHLIIAITGPEFG